MVEMFWEKGAVAALLLVGIECAGEGEARGKESACPMQDSLYAGQERENGPLENTMEVEEEENTKINPQPSASTSREEEGKGRKRKRGEEGFLQPHLSVLVRMQEKLEGPLLHKVRFLLALNEERDEEEARVKLRQLTAEVIDEIHIVHNEISIVHLFAAEEEENAAVDSLLCRHERYRMLADSMVALSQRMVDTGMKLEVLLERLGSPDA